MADETPLFFCGARAQELARARSGQMKWRKRELTWCIVDRLPQIPLVSQVNWTAWAFHQYRLATNGWFSYRQVVKHDDADIILTTFRDRPNGVLADMQLPPGDDRQLMGRFDSAEPWNASPQAVQYQLTALHELGHAHGMNHIDDRRMPSVLDSVYNPKLLKLQKLDIEVLLNTYPEARSLPPLDPEEPVPGVVDPAKPATPKPAPGPGRYDGPTTIVFSNGETYAGDLKRII